MVCKKNVTLCSC